MDRDVLDVDSGYTGRLFPGKLVDVVLHLILYLGLGCTNPIYPHLSFTFLLPGHCHKISGFYRRSKEASKDSLISQSVQTNGLRLQGAIASIRFTDSVIQPFPFQVIQRIMRKLLYISFRRVLHLLYCGSF